MNEENQFLEETKEVNIMDQPLVPEETQDADDPEEQPESVKDRRHRRLEEKLQAERESNIALAARLEAIAEAKKATAEDADYLKGVERIYGTDTPESTAATELLKNALKGVKDDARREAIDAFREEQREQAAEVRKEEARLESMIEDIEDTYNTDLSSQAVRKGFFSLLEKLSPKDSDGNVIQYADHHAVYEQFKSQSQKRNGNRAKDIASRSMTNSGSSSESKLQDDASLRFLKENGII